MNLIIPAAGKSSRFPGMKPKWMQTHPNGNLMIVEAIKGLNLASFEKVYIGVLNEHVKEYDFVSGLVKALSKIGIKEKIEIVTLDETQSQPETVACILEKCQITGPIFIKDTDNFFQCEVTADNFVAIYDINEMGLVNAGNKSYVQINDDNRIINLVEKRIISSYFCVGGYSFSSAIEYLEYFKRMENSNNLYISHIIFNMILDNIPFGTKSVEKYEDWGTLQEWNRYKDTFGVLFVDIDGTLVENSGQFFEPVWGTTSALQKNVDAINKLHDSGKVQIILTTSRSEEYRQTTLEQLKKFDIKYDQVIFNLYHARRIIINDYAKTNPYRCCDAINLKRNSDELNDLLEAVMRTTI